MAGSENMTPGDAREQMKQLKATKRELAKSKKAQQKEARLKARELEAQQRELDEQMDGNGFSIMLVTVFIVAIWLGILTLLIKLDIGGFGSGVLAPIFQDVPVINKILPSESMTESGDGQTYGGYNNLKEAVDEIRNLELQLEQLQNANSTYLEQIETLKTEVERLKTFEDSQVDFQRVKEEFYKEVVYAENGPGPDEYRKYFEEMDQATAEALYKQVLGTVATDKAKLEYARTFSNMDASAAAKILQSMTDNLELAADILQTLDAANRGQIMGEMDAAIAAKIAKLMSPE